MSTPDMKTPAELAAWLLYEVAEFRAKDTEENRSILEAMYEAHAALTGEDDKGAGCEIDSKKAAALLHEAFAQCLTPVPEPIRGRDSTRRYRKLVAQQQREGALLPALQIALTLLQPEAKPAATTPAPASDAKLIDAAEAAETFAGALRAAAGMSTRETA